MIDRRQRAIAQLRRLWEAREPRREIAWALMGDAEGTLEVPGQAGKVYCRLFGQINLTVRAWNRTVNPVAGRRVDVEVLREPGMPDDYYVLGPGRVDYGGYGDYSPPYWLIAHGETHERRPGGGADVVNVYKRAITELRADQQETPDMTVVVSAGFYLTTVLQYFTGGDSPAFAAAPGGDGQRYDLLYLDTATQALAIREGGAGPPGWVERPQPQANEVPIAWVRFTTETAIVDDMITDARVTIVTMGAHGLVIAHPLDPAAGVHTGTLPEAEVVFADTGHAHISGAGGKKVDHGNLLGVTVDQHHAQAHTLASHSTKAHTELTGVTADQHHTQTHKNEHKSGGGDAFASADLLEAVVKRLRESGGPTDLLLGAVADGEFLKRSGAGIVGGEAGAGGGGMMPFWEFRGALAVLAGAGTPVRMPYPGTVEAVLLLVETQGTASSTIIDIHKEGVTIFTTQGNRPEVAFDAPADFDVGVPDITDFDQYDEFTVDFDQVADDSEDAWVLIICQMSPGGIITTIEVQEDDVAVVAEASIVNFEGEGVEVTDEGGGKATVTIPGGGDGGGAPTDAKYVVTAPDATLTDEIVIPGLEACADIEPAAPNAEDDEFDSDVLDPKWTRTTDAGAHDIDTTWPSHVFVKFTGNQGYNLSQAYAPAGAFTIAAKFRVAPQANYQGAFIYVYDGDESECLRISYHFEAACKFTVSRKVSNVWTYSFIALSTAMQNEVYLLIQRGAANDWTFWGSFDGLSWWRIGTYSFTFTVDHFEVDLCQEGSTIPVRVGIDWVRRDWLTP